MSRFSRTPPHPLRDPSLSPRLGMTFLPMVVALLVWGVVTSSAAEVMPPKPAGYFNDYAGVVSQSAALRFNEQLAQFERETSNQVLVVVFRAMQTDSSIEDYTQRVAQSWGAGQEDKRNGSVLFVFIGDRKMYIQVGYGLEGVLPDVTAFDITERNIKPKFKTGDYEGGLATGIDLMMRAIRGEYKGSGRTVAESGKQKITNLPCIFFFLIFILFLILSGSRRGRRRRGWGYTGMGGPFIGGGGGGWGGGSSSGGGGFSGFSGGGGSFGGGGGGSSW